MGAQLTFLVFFLFSSLVLARAPWPTTEWGERDLLASGFSPVGFQKFRDFTFDPRARYKTDALVVIKDGYLVYEEYAHGYSSTQPHMLWSFTKGITNGIIGVAEQKGILSRRTLVSQHYPQLRANGGQDMTMEHLMQMTSGLDYYEENPISIVLSDSILITYSLNGYRDTAEFMASKPLRHRPGSQFNYSSGDPNLAMGVLRKAINDPSEYNAFPFRELFWRLGMRSTTLEQDLAGNYVGGAFAWSTARDIAKYGYLFLNDGVWEGRRLLPRDWVRWSLTTVPALRRPGLVQENEMRLNQEDYGAWWWLNKKLPMNKTRPFPHAPEDLYLAMGYKGQTMAILPSMGLIVVRLGNDGLEPDSKLDRPQFMRLLLESLQPPISDPFPIPDEKRESVYAFRGLSNFFALLRAFLSVGTDLDDGIVMAPAKDLCSCIYVVGQSPKYCLDNHEQYQLFRRIGIFDGWVREAKIDHRRFSVTVENHHQAAEARFVDRQVGCKVVSFRDKQRPPPHDELIR